jgi:branched-chain amino acid transport system ATP-binding protein
MRVAAPLLKVSNLETYYGPVMAIRGVSFAVEEGSICTILGANGAGKTTVLKTISGAMDPRVGSVEFAGSPVQGRLPSAVSAMCRRGASCSRVCRYTITS